MAEKFSVEQKEQIVIESFTATNIAELCRRHGVSVAQFHRWKERFLDGGRNGSEESSRGNEYQKEIDDLKRLVGDQAPVIDALKKSTGEETTMAIESLKPAMTVSRISRAMDVPRSSIYYRKTERSGRRKPRVSEIIEARSGS